MPRPIDGCRRKNGNNHGADPFLRLVVPDRAGQLYLDGIVFLDKEVFTGLPRGERREADLVAFVRHKLACKRPIAAAGHLNDLERFLLENFVETYVELTPEEAAEYELLCASEENREVRAMELTWADRMEAKYFEAWAERMRPKYEAKIEAGRKEARKEGREEGARRLLLRLLRQRFGPLPEETRHRVEAIGSFERLQELADRILVAGSLEEMGLV